MLLDLHTHTRIGSDDSRIEGHDLRGLTGRFPGLDGIVLTEHERRWSEEALGLLPADGAVVVNARELSTAYGHIIVLGLDDERLAEPKTVEELRRVVVDGGGAMILAHPFRHYPSSWNLLFPRSRDHWGPRELAEWPAGRLAEHPVFALVDAVEVLNGGCAPRQNVIAFEVARALGLPCVGASDAHDLYAIGYYATAFEDTIRDEAALIAALRAGRCQPVHRTREGRYARADEDLFAAAK